MDLGKNGNRADFGQIRAKFEGNQKEMRLVSTNSDMVCGTPLETRINPTNNRANVPKD